MILRRGKESEKLLAACSTCHLFGGLVEVCLQLGDAVVVLVLEKRKAQHLTLSLFIHLQHHSLTAVSQQVAVFGYGAVLRGRQAKNDHPCAGDTFRANLAFSAACDPSCAAVAVQVPLLL